MVDMPDSRAMMSDDRDLSSSNQRKILMYSHELMMKSRDNSSLTEEIEANLDQISDD